MSNLDLKKYEASDMREALTRIKRELGPDAVIVATREISGLFNKKRLEVTAGIDPKTSGDEAVDPNEAAAGDDPLERRLAPLRHELRSLRQVLRSRERGAHEDHLREQVEDLRLQLGALTTRLPSESPDLETAVLRAADVEAEIALEIAASVEPATNQDQDNEALVAAVAASLLGGVELPPLEGMLAVVGPTGVGKTTTIAKLAVQAALVENKRVALVTTDTYRVGAVDQLRHFADLIGVPLAVAKDEELFGQVIASYADRDLILIDTAGRNPNDTQQIERLTRLLALPELPQPRTILLAVAAASRQLELRRIIDRYQAIGPTALLFTKLDEAEALGAVLNARVHSGLPLSYVTFGQRVPEDFAPADPRALAGQLVAKGMAALKTLGPRVPKTRPRANQEVSQWA